MEGQEEMRLWLKGWNLELNIEEDNWIWEVIWSEL